MARARWGIAAAAVCGALALAGCATHIAGDPTGGGTTQAATTDQSSGTRAPTNPPTDTPTAPPTGQLPTRLPTGQLTLNPPASSDQPTNPPTSGRPTGGSTSLAQTVTSAQVVDSKPYLMSGDPTSLGFNSPSGNITCMIFTADEGQEEVQCDITDHTFTPAAHDCHGAGVWGRRVQLLTGQAPRFICAGDYLGQWPALDYGNALAQGSISCASETDGVTCVDAVTGNGFRLARASYVLQPGDSSDSTADPDSPIADFAGVWDQHGGEIVFNSSGAGDYRYRTYVDCASAPAPCDRMVNNEIIAGGHLTLTLTSATPGSGGTTATGSVTASNDPRIHQGSPVKATISDGRLQIPAISDVPFCPPGDTSGQCGA